MKRGGPIQRKTPLCADPTKTRDWEQRSRKRLPAKSATRVARGDEMSVPDSVRAQVRERSQGHCEVRLDGCGDRLGLAPHHRLRSGQGGPSTPENLVDTCGNCHTMSPAAIHRNITWAERVGLLVRSHEGPPSEAWERSRLGQG